MQFSYLSLFSLELFSFRLRTTRPWHTRIQKYI